ncbi:MAG: hypothetical protein WHS89_12525 [Acidimicrobiales bacterium]
MRKLGGLLLAVLLVGSLAGCSSKKSETGTAKEDAKEASAQTGSEKSSSTESTAKQSGSDDATSGSNELNGSAFSGFADCTKAVGAYASISFLARNAQDEQTVAEVQKSLADLQGQVPAEIHDDLQVIADGIARSKNLKELSDFFDSDEYKKANENVEKYLDEQCGAG